MRNYRSHSGPFLKRPYYTNEEIERICTDELKAAALLPEIPSPIRIDRFLEKRFGVTVEYEDLGDGVLGLTKFGPKGVQSIIVARALDEVGTTTAERRIRTTMAHEGGHGLLHTHLFAMSSQAQPLFGDFSDPAAPKVLCRDVAGSSAEGGRGYDGRWWEFQANRAIGALLLPRQLVQMALEPLLEPAGLLGRKLLNSGRRGEAMKLVADTFEVNPVVARIRLQEIYPEADEAQLRL